jgi:hypothetical protein
MKILDVILINLASFILEKNYPGGLITNQFNYVDFHDKTY